MRSKSNSKYKLINVIKSFIFTYLHFYNNRQCIKSAYIRRKYTDVLEKYKKLHITWFVWFCFDLFVRLHDRALTSRHLISQLTHIRQSLASRHLRHHSSAHVGHDGHSVLIKLEAWSKVSYDVGGRLAEVLHIEHELHETWEIVWFGIIHG